MARTAATGATSANTSKKRKTAGDGDDQPTTAKRARTTATTTKSAPLKTKAKANVTKKTATKAPAKKSTAASAKTAGTTVAAKKASTTKTATKAIEPTAKPKINGVSKRKTDDGELVEAQMAKAEDDQETAVKKQPAAKKSKVEKPKAEPKPRKKGPVINERPTEIMNVFVFGENSGGELGLGHEGKVKDVKRPRLNPLLKDKKVVQVAAGGMHQVFLTADGKILTCGVNDQSALGRNTEGGEKLRDMDADDSEDEDDSGLNSKEAAPMEVDLTEVPQDTVFTYVAAGDSVTFAITDEGLVYGCGTFRSNEGILGFTDSVKIQHTLVQIQGLKNIKAISCGTNHVLALDKKGNVWAWGSGQQNQLGRRVVERTRLAGLTPREFGLPKNRIVSVATGSYHSFAIDNKDQVWTWGLNSFGETGIEDNAGEDEAVILKPTVAKQLSSRGIVRLAGGAHHSLAVTDKGEALVWGRVDGNQTGLKITDLAADDVVRDEHDRVRILKTATALPGVGHATWPACGSDQSFIVNRDGKAFAWGFSANYQTGLGTDDDVEVATLIDNTATREEKLVFAGAGGQYGVLTSVQKSA